MEEEFLRIYYYVQKTTSVQKAILELAQVPRETFHKARERLRDLIRECPHHRVSKHELAKIFYDRLGLQDRYLLDAASDDILMRKFEDNAMELNSHHTAEKPFVRGGMPNRELIDAKSTETGILL